MNEILKLIPLRMLYGGGTLKVELQKGRTYSSFVFTISSREKCRQCLNAKERNFYIESSPYIAYTYCFNEVNLICCEFVSSCIMIVLSAKML
jgi:hypothetical protein